MNTMTLIRAVTLLSGTGGTTIMEMQTKLGISRRTAYRILERMQDLGFPLYDELIDGRRKRWCLDESYVTRLPNINLPDMKLNQEEILLLGILLSSGSPLEDSGWSNVKSSLNRKMGDFVPDSGKATITTLKSGRKNYQGKEKFLNQLSHAIIGRHVCSGEYRSFSHGQSFNLTFRPLRLFEWNRGIYVFCLLEPNLAPRMLAMERFESLERNETNFPGSDIDPEKLLEKAFTVVWDDPIRVLIEFDAASAPYVKARHWAPGQTFTDKPDGSTILTMETSGKDDVLHWVLGFGPAARVLKPESLAESVHNQLKETMARYTITD